VILPSNVSYDYMPLVSGAQAAGHNIIGPARQYRPVYCWSTGTARAVGLGSCMGGVLQFGGGGGLLPVGLGTILQFRA
jgi:hypothetical protein